MNSPFLERWSTVFDIRNRVFLGKGLFVGPRRGQGIEIVGQRNDPCLERNGLAREAVRVTGAVEIFMMIADHGNKVPEQVAV